MHPLESFTIKFGRAQEHADQLHGAIRDHRYSISMKADLDPEGSGDYRVIIRDPPSVPPLWQALMGDAIHNYRASLDHLIWGLTVIDGGKTGRWTQFPILRCDAWEEESKWSARETVGQLSPINREIVKELQPYNGWDGPGQHPLLRLNKLENIDKHRHFNTVFLLPMSTVFEVKDRRDFKVTNLEAVDLGQRLVPEAVVATWDGEVTGLNPYIHVEAELAAQIEFEDGTGVVDTLNAISGFFASDVARLLPDDVKVTLAPRAA